MSKKIKVIIGSTRTGRIGKAISEKLISLARENNHDVELIDIQDFELPFMNSMVPPAMAPIDEDHVNKWREVIQSADGVVVVSAEYNRSVPAPLKNAIDSLAGEWEGKPTAIISYGMVDGGVSVTRHLRDIFGWLKADIVEHNVNIKISRSHFNEKQEFTGVDDAIGPVSEDYKQALQQIEQA